MIPVPIREVQARIGFLPIPDRPIRVFLPLPPDRTAISGRQRGCIPKSQGRKSELSWQKGTARPLINAHSETIATKPTFRNAIARRRFLVPTDGFFEWKRDIKPVQPFRFRLQNEAPFRFAGIWEIDVIRSRKSGVHLPLDHHPLHFTVDSNIGISDVDDLRPGSPDSSSRFTGRAIRACDDFIQSAPLSPKGSNGIGS